MIRIVKMAESVAAVHTHTHTCCLSNKVSTSGALFDMDIKDG